MLVQQFHSCLHEIFVSVMFLCFTPPQYSQQNPYAKSRQHESVLRPKSRGEYYIALRVLLFVVSSYQTQWLKQCKKSSPSLWQDQQRATTQTVRQTTNLQSLCDRIWAPDQALQSMLTVLLFVFLLNVSICFYMYPAFAAWKAAVSWSMRHSHLHQKISRSNNCTPAENQNSRFCILADTFRPIVLTHVWIIHYLPLHYHYVSM